MRYDFQCLECGVVEEHIFSMAEKPAQVTCRCGGMAESIISPNIEVMVRDVERPIKLGALDVPIGWDKGNTPEAQHERYKRIHKRNTKLAQEGKKNGIKNGVQWIASVPRELDRLRKKQYGKDYYLSDTERKLKSDGMLFDGC